MAFDDVVVLVVVVEGDGINRPTGIICSDAHDRSLVPAVLLPAPARLDPGAYFVLGRRERRQRRGRRLRPRDRFGRAQGYKLCEGNLETRGRAEPKASSWTVVSTWLASREPQVRLLVAPALGNAGASVQ